MMTSLFSIFDPSTSNSFSLNWLSIFLPFLFFPYKYWMLNSRIQMIWMNFYLFMMNEFKMLSIKKFHSNLLFFFSLMSLILFFNLMGLFPYIFTPTSHISINLTMSLIMWTSFMMFGWMINYKKMLIHMVPKNTPMMLMNFMVIIETLSNIIRPWTLMIRLTANMLAGHLLLSLLGSAIKIFKLFLPITISLQNLLLMLEMSVSLIQMYVFIILLILYFNESN